MDKKAAISDLLQSKFVHDRLTARVESTRRAKLAKFLAAHQHASQWATCCAALQDAVRHKVVPSDAMICDAISRCGQRGRMREAKSLYTNFYREIGKPRSLAAHVAFMGACAACGDFREAREQFQRLWQRDVAMFAKSESHKPVVTDDLTTEYLRAALAATVAQPRSDRGGGDGATASSSTATAAAAADDASQSQRSPAEVALDDFVAVRKDPHLRPHNAFTPLLIESAVHLAEAGNQWSLCLRILQSASREQALIPPEAYDAAVRACFRGQRHGDVVSLMSQLIATKTPPDERSVRLAMVSSEEVTAAEAAAGAPFPSSSWALSLTLFNAMQHNGLPMYQQSYESPLRSCALAGKWEQALDIVRVMRRDRRPVSSELYRVALAARVESCSSYAEVERFLRTPVVGEGAPSIVVYLAALRCLMRLKDWKHFEMVNREMRDRDMPEPYDKIKILIEAAYEQGKYHSVLMRFARIDNITTFERQRVVKDNTVRLFEADFDVSDRLLDMVLDAYEKVKGHADPMVEVAYRAALRRKQRGGATQLHYSTGQAQETPEWMYSAQTREQRSPASFR